MKSTFNHSNLRSTIVFGNGRSSELADWMDRLGCKKALFLATPHQAADVMQMSESVGHRSAGLFGEAAMHTPVEVTNRALVQYEQGGADCVVAYGGGSTTGLGKALSHRTGATQIIIATTYAGSEVTPILGQTENNLKTTIRSDEILPDLVIYDPLLTLGLPVPISVTSGLNAMAHAAEALYAKDRSPISSMMAREGLRAMRDALPTIVTKSDDIEARQAALYGAWLCGSVLGQVSMALHHKICHTLGGTLNTPHAETHAIMLPHTIGFNGEVAGRELEPVANLFGASPGPALYDFAASIDAPRSLKSLGLKEADLDLAAEMALQKPYWNPRSFDQSGIRSMLQDAYEGKRPAN